MRQLLKRWRGQPDGANGDNSTRALTKHRGNGSSDLASWRDEFDRAFDRMWNDLAMQPWRAFGAAGDLPGFNFGTGRFADWPAMDVDEDEKSITLRVDVPGFGPEDVDVEVSGNRLTVRGRHQEEHKDDRRGAYRHERRSGSFVRTITLPAYADGNNVEARNDKGVLTVTVPKASGQGARRVRVTA